MWKPIFKEILVRVRYLDPREDYKTLRIGSRRAKKSFPDYPEVTAKFRRRIFVD